MRLPIPALVSVAALCGCFGSCDPPGPPEPEVCDRYSGRDSGLVEAVPRDIELGSGRGAAFVPYTADGDVPLVTGGQGAVMIMPVVRSAADPGVDRACFEVHIVNTVEGSTAYLPELGGGYVFRREGEFLFSDPLFDQLSYASSEVEGMMLNLEVSVTGGGTTATRSLRVVPRM